MLYLLIKHYEIGTGGQSTKDFQEFDSIDELNDYIKSILRDENNPQDYTFTIVKSSDSSSFKGDEYLKNNIG